MVLGVVVVALLGLAIATAGQYGRSVDVTADQVYGRDAVRFYTTLGHDRAAIDAEAWQETHGPLSQEALYLAGKVLGRGMAMRNLLVALFGILGVLAIGLCGFALRRPWVGVAAALILVLTPRWYGDMFTNSKDVPFAAAIWLALFCGLMLMREWRGHWRRWGVSLAVFTGIAMAIRVGAVLAWVLLLGAAGAHRVLHGRGSATDLRRLALVCGAVILGSFALATLVWPYLLVSPLAHFARAVAISAHYPWNGSVLFDGRLVPAITEPVSYTPVWLLAATPPPTLLLGGAGVVLAFAALATRSRRDLAWLVVAGAFLLPIAVILAGHAILYDGVRQILFVLGPLALLAAYALAELLGRLGRLNPLATVAAVAVTILAYGQAGVEMAALHPYEYIYFSPLAGDLRGASHNFDTDYWGLCYRDSAKWLADHQAAFAGPRPLRVLATLDPNQTLGYLDPGGFKYGAIDPDLYVTAIREGRESAFPAYSVLMRVTREGVTLCEIKARPGLLTGAAARP
jgi:hypothetical protein